MPHFDLTVNIPALVGWLIGGATFVWYASAFVTEMRALRKEFQDHEAQDDKRHEDVQSTYRDQETRLRQLEIAVGPSKR